MQFDAYRAHDALGLAELVRSGQTTALELVETAIAAVEAQNGVLNAVVYKAYDDARARASQPVSGPLAGVPFLIKDLGLQVAGWPRTSGSRFASDAPDEQDSELTTRFRAAGVIAIGKSNTPEYGIPGVTISERLGICRNPWNTDHIPGGSSGGAASAVAAGLVPLAHASDGLGSIRIPAACCGLVGMKTTRDRNPNGPEDYDRAIGFAVDHVVSRSVRDSAAMLDATGYPEIDSPYAYPFKTAPYLEEVTTPPGKLRVGWSTATPSGRPIDPEMQAAVERTATLLEDLGHDVEAHDIAVDWRAYYSARGYVSAANFSAGMKRRVAAMGREPNDDELERMARRGYQAGTLITGQDALWGWQELRALNRTVLRDLAPYDVFLSPVMSAPAPRIEDFNPLTLDAREFDRRQSALYPYAAVFNFTGQPSLSLPLWWSEGGLPMGMMFTGRYGDEGTLFRLAGQLEQAQPWRDLRPPAVAAA